MQDGRGTDEHKGGSEGGPDESLEARRRRLDAELAARREERAESEVERKPAEGFALAVKLSSEFIAGVIVGALIGYLVDRFLGTGPWGLIVFLLLGFCAGVLNILRSTGAVAEASWKAGPRRGGQGHDEK